MKRQKSYLMPAEVAEMLAVSSVTVRSLAETGKLESFTTAGGHRRFRRGDVERYAADNGLVLNRLHGTSYRLLIVDDDLAFAGVMEQLIATLPYEIETEVAHNGFQAGFKAKQNAPDLILLDIMMPGVSGIEVTAVVKGEPETSPIRIIGMTGGATGSRQTNMVDVGAERVLTKPFHLDELVAAIGTEVLAGFPRSTGKRAVLRRS